MWSLSHREVEVPNVFFNKENWKQYKHLSREEHYSTSYAVIKKIEVVRMYSFTWNDVHDLLPEKSIMAGWWH